MTDPYSTEKLFPEDDDLTPPDAHPPTSGAGDEFGNETDDLLFGQTQPDFEDDDDGWDPHEALVQPPRVGVLRGVLGRTLPFLVLAAIAYGIYRLHLPLYATIPLGIVGIVMFAVLIFTLFRLAALIKCPECGQNTVLWWGRKIHCPDCGFLDIRDYR